MTFLQKQEFDIINQTRTLTSPALSGEKIRSEDKPFSIAYWATGEGKTFLPLSLLDGGCVTMPAT